MQADETARFDCSGVGSFIGISWRFNHSIICNGDSCDSNLLSYHQVIRANSTNNLTIDSTLTINTGQLLLLPGALYSVECWVEQLIPAALNLTGLQDVFFTNLRVINDGKLAFDF